MAKKSGITGALGVKRRRTGVLTPGELKRVGKAAEEYRKRLLKQREDQYKPTEEFIAEKGLCTKDGKPHRVIKITAYHWVPDTSGIIGPGSRSSIGSSVRYCCEACGVSFDPRVDPAYEESHPIESDHDLY